MSETENQKNDEEVSVIDLFAVLFKRKKFIIFFTLISCIVIVALSIISLILPPEKSFLANKYTPEAQMLINDKDSNGGSISSMLSSSGLSSLASLAGVNVGKGGSSNSSLAGYLVNSNTVQDAVIKEFDLTKRYKIKKHPIAETRKALKKKLTSKFDEDTGVFTVSFTDLDPVFAQKVVNYVVDLLEQRFLEIGVDKNKLEKANLEENIENCYKNILDLQKQSQKLERSSAQGYGIDSIIMDAELLKMELEVQKTIYASLKAQYESLKVSMASEQPIFQILEYAEVPDQKSEPSRGKLCIIVAFVSFFLSIFIVFLKNAIDNVKKDPVAMSKLKGNK